MLTLLAKTRETSEKTRKIRNNQMIPAVLYGPEVKNLVLQVNLKEFNKIFNEVGKASLIKIEIEGDSKKDYNALIHDIQRDTIENTVNHIDFYVPPAKKEITIKIPIIFDGEAPAIKELGGTFVRGIHEIEIKGLIINLPKEIRVDISGLKSFEDRILVKDLKVPEGIKILKNPEETVALVTPVEKVEEELAKPVEGGVEDVKVIEKEKKDEVSEEPTTEKTK